jgi:hypothetical protein
MSECADLISVGTLKIYTKRYYSEITFSFLSAWKVSVQQKFDFKILKCLIAWTRGQSLFQTRILVYLPIDSEMSTSTADCRFQITSSDFLQINSRDRLLFAVPTYLNCCINEGRRSWSQTHHQSIKMRGLGTS